MAETLRRDARATRGFTLLELIAVMGVLAVLFGLGIGMLQRGDTDRGEALSAIRGELRSAALTARRRGQPTEVVIAPGEDGGPGRAHARLLESVAVWHLEPGDRYVSADFVPSLAGEPVVSGRFGQARRNVPGEKAPLFHIAAFGPPWDLSAGFVFRVDLNLETAEETIVARLGDSLELRIGGDLRPRARMVQRGVGTRRGVTAVVDGVRSAPLRSWFTLELFHDGEALVLSIDDREVGRASAPQPLYQQESDVLEISPGDAPVPGVVDEIQLWAYQWSPPQSLPLSVEVPERYRLRFDRRGQVIGADGFELRFAEDEGPTRFTVTAGGVVR